MRKWVVFFATIVLTFACSGLVSASSLVFTFGGLQPSYSDADFFQFTHESKLIHKDKNSADFFGVGDLSFRAETMKPFGAITIAHLDGSAPMTQVVTWPTANGNGNSISGKIDRSEIYYLSAESSEIEIPSRMARGLFESENAIQAKGTPEPMAMLFIGIGFIIMAVLGRKHFLHKLKDKNFGILDSKPLSH